MCYKNRISRVLIFCEWQVFENVKFVIFQYHRKQNKKKAVESRDTRLIFLSRSMERQAGHDGKTVVID